MGTGIYPEGAAGDHGHAVLGERGGHFQRHVVAVRGRRPGPDHGQRVKAGEPDVGGAAHPQQPQPLALIQRRDSSRARVVVEILEILAIVLASLTGLAATAGLVYLVVRLRHRYDAPSGLGSYRPAVVLRHRADATDAVQPTPEHPAIGYPEARIYDLTKAIRDRQNPDSPPHA